MKSEELLNAIGIVDDSYILESAPQAEPVIHLHKAWFKRPILVAAAAVCFILAGTITAYAVETYHYNAAVDYLNSLGVSAKDLSNYSRQEITQAVDVLEAGHTNELTKKILPPQSNSSSSDTLAKVSSAQIRSLTPTMTYQEVLQTLGKTKDVGSGFLILAYEVDNRYTLNIPFASVNAQLGVTGEKLLEALQPKK